MKGLKMNWLAGLGVLCFLSLFAHGLSFGEETVQAPEKTESAPQKTELDKLKTEWEAVREQQIQMIREKEDQLEKLKEEIFSKMKALKTSEEPSLGASQLATTPAPAPSVPEKVTSVSMGNSELEKQKETLQAERQKFFKEMNRQKESLRQLQASLDEKAKQLEAERDRFEQEKKKTP